MGVELAGGQMNGFLAILIKLALGLISLGICDQCDRKDSGTKVCSRPDTENFVLEGNVVRFI